MKVLKPVGSCRLKIGDVTALENRIPEIQYIAPRNTKGVFGDEPALVANRGKNRVVMLYMGISQYSPKLLHKKIYDGGRFINEEDIEQTRKVCVIGERTQQELFEKDENPIGGLY